MKPELRLPVLGKVDRADHALARAGSSLRDVDLQRRRDRGPDDLGPGPDVGPVQVEKKPEALDVAIEPIPQPAGAKGSKYRMSSRSIPGTPAGRIIDEIVLKTDHPQATEVRVPVDVLVQGPD